MCVCFVFPWMYYLVFYHVTLSIYVFSVSLTMVGVVLCTKNINKNVQVWLETLCVQCENTAIHCFQLLSWY